MNFGEKRIHNCVIWPENHESGEKKCVIHAYERRILHGDRSKSSQLQAYPDENHIQFIALYFLTIKSTLSDYNARTGQQKVDVNFTINEVYAQRWDKGGSYLNPQLVEGGMPWE